eukprot:CAMPEP_0201551870 /NCGR_PEP_ID=MMETSP0173_2-20130828/11672_1 /ASSEMBLY_ACC=CAM_ASM_000268 /TAXON_ID=218659 /ORGANISM="Vexillifera sp., Strain DIVA3 564/2" /LENGTH=76 /DNA_ID=CAMNT_0047962221 /DNA_START=47 /DNA_END=277 /DNA_ORIENTATION=+
MSSKEKQVEQLQEAFYHFDTDQDFYIHIDELRRIITTDGEPMSAQDVEEFLAEATTFADGQGMVDYKSLAELMLSA